MYRLLLAVLAVAAAPVAADPHTDYLLYCRGCHLHTGDAVPAANVPSLRELAPLLATRAGRDYLVRVPGVAQTPMTDEQVAAVLNWVLGNFNADTLPADFVPFTANEVAAARGRVLPNPLQAREEILGGS
jgi:hypothetical protein